MDSYLERLQQELEDATAGSTPATLSKGPGGKWCAAEVLEHLYLTYLHTNRGLARCLEKGAPMARPIRIADRVRTFAVVNLGYFPTGRKSPERAVPTGMAAAEVRASIMDEILRMDAGFVECERKFGSSARLLDHPVLGPLNARQWRKFHWVHGRHHAAQIRERTGKK